MKKLFVSLALVASLGLAGCNTIGTAIQAASAIASVSTGQVVTPQIRQTAHLVYTALLTAAVHYREVGKDAAHPNGRQCRASEAAFPANQCYRRSVVVAMQVYNRKAALALRNLDDWAERNPTLNASALIDAVRTSMSSWASFASNNGIAVPPVSL